MPIAKRLVAYQIATHARSSLSELLKILHVVHSSFGGERFKMTYSHSAQSNYILTLNFYISWREPRLFMITKDKSRDGPKEQFGQHQSSFHKSTSLSRCFCFPIIIFCFPLYRLFSNRSYKTSNSLPIYIILSAILQTSHSHNVQVQFMFDLEPRKILWNLSRIIVEKVIRRNC